MFSYCFIYCKISNYIIWAKIDIDDPTGEIAAELTLKYLGDAEMGNFTSMTPGLTDVSKKT